MKSENATSHFPFSLFLINCNVFPLTAHLDLGAPATNLDKIASPLCNLEFWTQTGIK